MTKAETKLLLEKCFGEDYEARCLCSKRIVGRYFREWVIINKCTHSVEMLFSEAEEGVYSIKYTDSCYAAKKILEFDSNF